jgi:hypothetical protein
MYEGAARPTSPLDTIIRSTSTHSFVFKWVYHDDGGGGEELTCLEKRLVANVDFDDQVL